MPKRAHISWKTKCASAIAALGKIPYDDLKMLTEDQFLSLWHWDHNILHSSENEARDLWWNLTPMLIQAHREKTKQDAKIIAKSKRIRAKTKEPTLAKLEQDLKTASFVVRKWMSRGFDKTLRKKMSGKVVKR